MQARPQALPHVYRSDGHAVLAHHFHNAYELIFITQGAADFRVGDSAGTYRQGDIVFISNLEQHRMQPAVTPYSRYVAMVEPDAFDRMAGDPILCSVFKRRPTGFLHGLSLTPGEAERCRDMLAFCQEECGKALPYYETRVMARLLDLLVLLYREHPASFPNTASASHVAEIQAYLDASYLQPLTLDGIAGTFHLNKYHLSHIFKEDTGYTVKRYVTLKRIAHAKDLLARTDGDISRIAADSGFNSASNFIRSFKAVEGITPLRFRQAYRYSDKA